MNKGMVQRKARRIKKITEKAPNLELVALFRQRRLERRFSLATVAEYLEISPAQLRLYESGKKNIPLQYIYGLSNCLGIDPDVVLGLLGRS